MMSLNKCPGLVSTEIVNHRKDLPVAGNPSNCSQLIPLSLHKWAL
jgi:hypothetical protein